MTRVAVEGMSRFVILFESRAGGIWVQGMLSVSGEVLVFKREPLLREWGVCKLMAFGSLLLPFPIGFWCDNIHCQVGSVTRHGNLTLAQGIKVGD